MAARRAMESITLDRGEMHLKDELSPRYAELVYNGFWFSPERLALQAAVDTTQQYVTGVVRVKLYKARSALPCRKHTGASSSARRALMPLVIDTLGRQALQGALCCPCQRHSGASSSARRALRPLS